METFQPWASPVSREAAASRGGLLRVAAPPQGDWVGECRSYFEKPTSFPEKVYLTVGSYRSSIFRILGKLHPFPSTAVPTKVNSG